MGSAISLLSCGTPSGSGENSDEKLVTRTVHNMEMTESENGRNSMIMRSPLVEEHAFANPAYTEHPGGIELIGYDSLGRNPSTRIIADNALNWTARDLWQLSGNVFAEGEDRRRLYTQQLFYDARTGKIWSNVDCKFEMGEEVFVGVGFDATSNMDFAAIREITGYFFVDTTEGADGVDSLGGDAPLGAPLDGTAPAPSGANAEGSSSATASTSTATPSGTTAGTNSGTNTNAGTRAGTPASTTPPASLGRAAGNRPAMSIKRDAALSKSAETPAAVEIKEETALKEVVQKTAAAQNAAQDAAEDAGTKQKDAPTPDAGLEMNDTPAADAGPEVGEDTQTRER